MFGLFQIQQLKVAYMRAAGFKRKTTNLLSFEVNHEDSKCFHFSWEQRGFGELILFFFLCNLFCMIQSIQTAFAGQKRKESLLPSHYRAFTSVVTQGPRLGEITLHPTNFWWQFQSERKRSRSADQTRTKNPVIKCQTAQ